MRRANEVCTARAHSQRFHVMTASQKVPEYSTQHPKSCHRRHYMCIPAGSCKQVHPSTNQDEHKVFQPPHHSATTNMAGQQHAMHAINHAIPRQHASYPTSTTCCTSCPSSLPKKPPRISSTPKPKRQRAENSKPFLNLSSPCACGAARAPCAPGSSSAAPARAPESPRHPQTGPAHASHGPCPQPLHAPQ